jgi:hypothetical protein
LGPDYEQQRTCGRDELREISSRSRYANGVQQMSDQTCGTHPYEIGANFQGRLRHGGEVLVCFCIADQYVGLVGCVCHCGTYRVSTVTDRFYRHEFASEIGGTHHVKQGSAASQPLQPPKFGIFERDAVEMLPAVERRATERRKRRGYNSDRSPPRGAMGQIPKRVEQRGNFQSDMATQR